MSLDEKVLSQLTQDTAKREFHLYYQDKVYSLEDVTIIKSQMPVNKPTSRGGVYSVNDKEYKIIGTISDLYLVPFISKMMLDQTLNFRKFMSKHP